ncbi:MAG: hypothetical protein ACOCRK_00865 [bacterium]
MEILKHYSVIEDIMKTVLKNIEDYKSKHPELSVSDLKLEINITSEIKGGGRGFVIVFKKNNTVHGSIILSEDKEAKVFDVWELLYGIHDEWVNLMCSNSKKETIKFTTNYIVDKIVGIVF